MIGKARTIALALLAGSFLLPATVQAADEFYKGKTVKIIVGFSPGGGYDIYARILGRNIDANLPGHPKVIVQNMTGAASLKAANYIYNTAPKDGTVFGTFGRTVALAALTSQGKNARFEGSKFTWIGTPASFGNDAYVLLARSNIPVKNINDLRKKGGYTLVLGSTGLGGTDTNTALVLRNVLGLNMKVIVGYPGGSRINMALERKEVDARLFGMSAIRSSRPQWLETTKIMQPLLQMARETRHPELSDVPLATELTNNQADKDLIKMIEIPFLMARPYAAPPALPAGRGKTLRDAFIKTVNGKKYREATGKLGMDVSPRTGEQLQALVTNLNSLPKALIKRYEDILANPKLQPRKVVWIKESGKITKLAKKNRRVTFDYGGKSRQASIAGGGYTTVTIKGKKASRKKLKVGMTCDITYEGNKTAAQTVACK